MTRDELIEELKKCPYNCDVTVFCDGIESDIQRVDGVPHITIYVED